MWPITGSLIVIALALTTQIGIGVYKRLIGCPRAFGDCYLPGTEALFWPQTVSMLSLYLALLTLLLVLVTWTLGWLFRRLRALMRR
ncbi:hypothetical protein [Pseudomonas sp. GD03944]|uniref:hypothetical protein n=1 Tax=Pseudomonas sp. GD03944 TaxID=2975409 RepID=UPI002447B0E2|nr:hypothetical protein [Pseudomonas sp. GD03944]MDH1263091.1 hypothetical protein [Pseudomonas sp. GD03944]